MSDNKHYLGFDIGGTKTAVILADTEKRVLAREVFATAEQGGWRNVLDKACAIAKELLPDGGEYISAGVSCGGPLDSKKGLIQSPPNLPGWDDVPVCGYIGERIGARVLLCNDANACAVAEWKLGAGRGTENMVFLTMGTGLGAGIIVNGRLLEGACGMAGEAGHIRLAEYGPVGYGKVGSFEGFCSGAGIAKLACLRAEEKLQMGIKPSWLPEGGLSAVSAKTIGLAADAGDEEAKAILAEAGDMLGRGIAVLADILNPEAVVIGSVYVRCRKHLEEACYAALRREALSASAECLRILPAELGESLGDLAAVCVAAGDCL